MKRVLFIFIALFLISCEDSNYANPYSYCNGVVVERNAGLGSWEFYIRHEGEVKGPINITKFDFTTFATGDTILCSDEDIKRDTTSKPIPIVL